MTTKQEWGNACWYLFHSLSFKLKDGQDHIVGEMMADDADSTLFTNYHFVDDNLWKNLRVWWGAYKRHMKGEACR